jgi:hypothetical protein
MGNVQTFPFLLFVQQLIMWKPQIMQYAEVIHIGICRDQGEVSFKQTSLAGVDSFSFGKISR